MAEKFQNKYRISSTRLQQWDYRWQAAYFITICTQARTHYFGEVAADGRMVLSPLGVIADICWHEITHHSHNVELGDFVVMPNHIHGILILGDNGVNNNHHGGEMCEGRDKAGLVSTTNKHEPGKPIEQSLTIGQQRFQNPGKNSVSSIIGGYKSAVSRHAHRLGFDFEWQSRFYDHIIRDTKSFETISAYIRNNPSKWSDDKFFSNE